MSTVPAPSLPRRDDGDADTHITLRIAIPDYLARDARFNPEQVAEVLGRMTELMLPMLAYGAISENRMRARVTRNWPEE
jgi:hypothetical protein